MIRKRRSNPDEIAGRGERVNDPDGTNLGWLFAKFSARLTNWIPRAAFFWIRSSRGREKSGGPKNRRDDENCTGTWPISAILTTCVLRFIHAHGYTDARIYRNASFPSIEARASLRAAVSFRVGRLINKNSARPDPVSALRYTSFNGGIRGCGVSAGTRAKLASCNTLVQHENLRSLWWSSAERNEYRWGLYQSTNEPWKRIFIIIIGWSAKFYRTGCLNSKYHIDKIM